MKKVNNKILNENSSLFIQYMQMIQSNLIIRNPQKREIILSY